MSLSYSLLSDNQLLHEIAGALVIIAILLVAVLVVLVAIWWRR